jgi:isoleucyl-tRNA synthetase
MAEDGQKMSKSLGNIVEPQNVYNQQGADILRLWVIGSDYAEDLRIGPEIVKQQADVYRRLRNTLRFLLGNLHGFSDSERVPLEDLPELERWVLDRLWRMDTALRETCENFQFHTFFTELHNFCTVDLSAFYLDIRKDSLYCDRLDEPRRCAARTVLDELFNCLTTWLAPFICFTAEEAWLARTGGDAVNSVHLRTFPDLPDAWRDDALMEKWRRVRAVRRAVTGALELERAEKRIGSSLQAAPRVFTDADTAALFADLNAAELFITSGAAFDTDTTPEDAFRLEDVADVAVVPALAGGQKCDRCYQVLEDVGSVDGHPTVCRRCADAADNHQPLGHG